MLGWIKHKLESRLPGERFKFIGRTDDEAETPILWPPDVKNRLIGKDPHVGKDRWHEEKGITEDEVVGESPMRWT